MKRTVRIDVHFERPNPWYGFELEVPEDLDESDDEFEQFIWDNIPIADAYPEEWHLA